MVIRLLLICLAFLSVNVRAEWNDGATTEIRQKIAANNIYGPDSGRLTVRNYDRTAKMINASLAASADIDGSKATASATIKVPASASKTAAASIKRLAKGGIAGMLGGAALQALIDGVGWVIDDGSKVIMKNNDNTIDPTVQYIYEVNSRVSSDGSTMSESCRLEKLYYQDASNRYGWGVTYTGSYVGAGDSSVYFYCYLQSTYNGVVQPDTKYPGQRFANPTYNPNAEKKLVAVSESELAAEIQKSIDAADGKADGLISAAYQSVDALGKATNDLNQAADGLNDAVKDLTDAMKDVLNSSNPVGTGKTDSIPSVTYNNTSITNNSTTTNNTTNETTTTTGTSEVKIPAFCEWASIVCKWIGWTQEEPELKDNELKIDDEDLPGYEHSDYVKFGQTCPFHAQSVVLDYGIGQMSFEADASILCTYGEIARPYIIGISHLGCLIYLLVALRNGAV